MLHIVVKRFIIYGGIFSAINFSAWSAEYTPSWSQRQQQSAACFMTGDETCMTFIDDAVRLASRQYGKRSIQLVRSLLLQSDIYQWLGKPELTPQMLLRARAIMKTFPAGTYPGDRADMFEHLAAFYVYGDDRHIEYSPTEQWRYEIKVDYRQRIAWQEQALTWRLKDKKTSTEAASFLQQKADIAYNAGHISEAINALSQALKIEQTLYGTEFGEMTVDSNNLAGFYAQGHHYKEAKDLYLKLIAYYQSRLTPMATVISRLRFYLPENIDLDSTSPYLPLLEEYKRRQSDVSMVLYGISLLYKNNQQLEQAKDFAERAFTLDAVAYPAKMQYERLQQLANIAEGLGDNAQARRYRQMSFRHRMAHSIYPGDPQYNDFAKPGGDRCG
ncbi:TPA: hypothetical protein OPX77_001977 [Salmonella enterica subsp. enterica serovar Typhi]|nr:hypothetical protein [Salmonella enterica subsp. enterica serovar Typhi]